MIWRKTQEGVVSKDKNEYGQTFAVDEVNFFAKRVESLTEYERKILSAYVSEHSVAELRDMINLTFSMEVHIG